MLHELAGSPFAEPKPLTEEERRTEAARHFEHWFPNAIEFQAGAADSGLAARHEIHPAVLCPPEPRLRRCAVLITSEVLAWLVERVSALQESVAAICADLLESVGANRPES